MLPSRDNKFSKNTRISPLIHENLFFLKTYYLVKEASDWSETFRDCYLSLDLHINKNSDRNTVIRFLSMCPGTGWNFSKTTITRKERPISAYHFRLLLASLGSTYAQSISSKAISKLVTLPRQLRLRCIFFRLYFGSDRVCKTKDLSFLSYSQNCFYRISELFIREKVQYHMLDDVQKHSDWIVDIFFASIGTSYSYCSIISSRPLFTAFNCTRTSGISISRIILIQL